MYAIRSYYGLWIGQKTSFEMHNRIQHFLTIEQVHVANPLFADVVREFQHGLPELVVYSVPLGVGREAERVFQHILIGILQAPVSVLNIGRVNLATGFIEYLEGIVQALS